MNFYCGKSSDNVFWTHYSPKYNPSVQNPECKTFYVNQSSGPCEKDNQCFLKVTKITTVALLRSENSDHIMKWKNVGEVELGPYT